LSRLSPSCNRDTRPVLRFAAHWQLLQPDKPASGERKKIKISFSQLNVLHFSLCLRSPRKYQRFFKGRQQLGNEAAEERRY
jgi:hypothetical protein